MLFLFTQEDVGCNKITIKDNRQVGFFLGLFFKRFLQKKWRKIIVIRNYGLKLFCTEEIAKLFAATD